MKISDEFIKKASKCKDANELYDLAKSEGIELSLEKANAFFSKDLTDEILEDVTGGTCRGNGYDNGRDRPIVTISNSCGLFKMTGRDEAIERSKCSATCKYCMYYSYNTPKYQKGKRISLVSGWCLHPAR